MWENDDPRQGSAAYPARGTGLVIQQLNVRAEGVTIFRVFDTKKRQVYALFGDWPSGTRRVGMTVPRIWEMTGVAPSPKLSRSTLDGRSS
jgi:hypothetical protein